jgi:hypothetical protein
MGDATERGVCFVWSMALLGQPVKGGSAAGYSINLFAI